MLTLPFDLNRRCNFHAWDYSMGWKNSLAQGGWKCLCTVRVVEISQQLSFFVFGYFKEVLFSFPN